MERSLQTSVVRRLSPVARRSAGGSAAAHAAPLAWSPSWELKEAKVSGSLPRPFLLPAASGARELWTCAHWRGKRWSGQALRQLLEVEWQAALPELSVDPGGRSAVPRASALKERL